MECYGVLWVVMRSNELLCGAAGCCRVLWGAMRCYVAQKGAIRCYEVQ